MRRDEACSGVLITHCFTTVDYNNEFLSFSVIVVFRIVNPLHPPQRTPNRQKDFTL